MPAWNPHRHHAVRVSCSEARVFPADLRHEQSPQQLIDFAIRQFGVIDLLVNNAGATKRGDFLQLTEEDWQERFALKFCFALAGLC